MFKQEDLKKLLIDLIKDTDVTLTVSKNMVEIEGVGDGINILVSTPLSIALSKMESKPQMEMNKIIHSSEDMVHPTSALDFERGRKSTNSEKVAIIKRLMEVEGLNQTEVAKRLNYTPGRISSILKHGKRSHMKLIKGA